MNFFLAKSQSINKRTLRYRTDGKLAKYFKLRKIISQYGFTSIFINNECDNIYRTLIN